MENKKACLLECVPQQLISEKQVCHLASFPAILSGCVTFQAKNRLRSVSTNNAVTKVCTDTWLKL